MGEIREEFETPHDTAVFTTKFVLDDNKTITYVTHELKDGAWQFFSDDSFDNFEEVAKIVGLQEIFDMDESLLKIADLPLGFYATRKDKFDNWTIKEDKKNIDYSLLMKILIVLFWPMWYQFTENDLKENGYYKKRRNKIICIIIGIVFYTIIIVIANI